MAVPEVDSYRVRSVMFEVLKLAKARPADRPAVIVEANQILTAIGFDRMSPEGRELLDDLIAAADKSMASYAAARARIAAPPPRPTSFAAARPTPPVSKYAEHWNHPRMITPACICTWNTKGEATDCDCRGF